MAIFFDIKTNYHKTIINRKESTMLTATQSKDLQLLGHWFYNAKYRIHNQEILHLKIPLHGTAEKILQVGKAFIRLVMKESHEKILEDSINCFATELYSLYITHTTNLSDIPYENNRNIILISPITINFTDFNRPILSICFKKHNLKLNGIWRSDFHADEILNELINNIDSFVNKPYINEYEETQYYFKQLPLLQIIRDKNYELIGNHLYGTIVKDYYHLKYEMLLAQTEYLYSRYHFKDLIIDDIKMFINQKILTARLSIIIYRLALWKFNEDRIFVNKFYSQKLGLGRPVQLYPSHLNLSFISRDLTFTQKFKGYDLRNLEDKQINLAKKIIKTQKKRYDGEFDIETIHEVTHLPYEQINKLIK